MLCVPAIRDCSDFRSKQIEHGFDDFHNVRRTITDYDDASTCFLELSRVTKVSTLLSIAREVVFMEDETMYPNLIVGLMRYGTAFLHFSLNASTAFVLCSRYTVVHCLPLLSCLSGDHVPKAVTIFQSLGLKATLFVTGHWYRNPMLGVLEKVAQRVLLRHPS